MKKTILLSLTLMAMGASAQKFENLAMTPPMGWNSWNKFACNVSETLIMETADAMVASGMKDAGYEYIVIDDCWQIGRDSMGFIIADTVRFASGMKTLVDYVHAKGLKFGIYSCAGTKTCGGRPGSRGYEFQDAYMYAKWGVDYLKYDWCDSEGQTGKESYTLMSQMLKKAGHPIVFSLCEWGNNKPWEWAKEVGHLWRTTGDIFDCFDCEYKHDSWSAWGAMRTMDQQADLREYAGPGHWNDPDMLEVGNGGLSIPECRAHFSMWCMMASPLIAGNDLRNMNQDVLSILTNHEAIAINQDVLGIQGMRVEVSDSLETWVKPLSNGEWAMCFLNRSKDAKTIDYDWKTNVVKDDFAKRELNGATEIFKITDVWTKKQLGTTKKSLKATIPSHDVLMVKLSK